MTTRRVSNSSSTVASAPISNVIVPIAKEKSLKTKTKNKDKNKTNKAKAKDLIHESRNPVSIVLATYLEECCRFSDVVEYLSYESIRSLSCTNHSIYKDISTSSASNATWKKILYSDVIDEFRDYEIKVEKEIRDNVESFFGCRKVALAVRSNTCSSCGKHAANLNLLDCSRACLDCFMCKDSGQHGADSKSPFALCAVGYAKTHYLLSDSEISSNLFVWSVDDDLKCHGLISSKVKVVLQNKAKALAHVKFGGEEGLRAEKTARAKKSETKWIEKCEAAKMQGKSAPKMPSQVQKEKAKDKSDHWNFVCANQKVAKLLINAQRYGYYWNIYGTKSLEDISPKAYTTMIVTDATDEELKLKYAGYEITRYIHPPPPPPPPSSSSSTAAAAAASVVSTEQTSVHENKGPSESMEQNAGANTSPSSSSSSSSSAAPTPLSLSSSLPKLEVHDNLVHAFIRSNDVDNDVDMLVSIIVDKLCDLRVMIKDAGQVTNGPRPVVREIEQINTIVIHERARVIGTSSGLIRSNNVIFWATGIDGLKFHFENLRMETFAETFEGNISSSFTISISPNT